MVTMAFVLVGQVNILAPIVTINFMLTYIAVDYSYFSLSMGPCNLSQVAELGVRDDSRALHCTEHLILEKTPRYGTEGFASSLSEGTLLQFTKDMDQLLQLTRKQDSCQSRWTETDGDPENLKGKHEKDTRQTLKDSFLLDLIPNTSLPPEDVDRASTISWDKQDFDWSKQTFGTRGSWPQGAGEELTIPELSRPPYPSADGEYWKATLGDSSFN